MPKTMAYQKNTNSYQDQNQNNNETGPADAIKASFVNQDSQMLTDSGYKEHEEFAGFVGIEIICCNCK